MEDNTVGLDEHYFMAATAARLYHDLGKLPAGSLVDYRPIKLARKIITQGNFYKISIMLTYFFANDPAPLRVAVHDKIKKCRRGIGAPIYLDWNGTAPERMREDEIDAWYNAVFPRG